MLDVVDICQEALSAEDQLPSLLFLQGSRKMNTAGMHCLRSELHRRLRWRETSDTKPGSLYNSPFRAPTSFARRGCF